MEYELCLELAQKLEVVKKLHLQRTPMVKTIADLIHKYGIVDLPYFNEVAESLLAFSITKEEEPAIELTPESLMSYGQLSEDLKPWAERLRRRFFGKVESPFTDYNSAVNWAKTYDVIRTDQNGSPDNVVEVSEPFRRNMRIYDPDDPGNDLVFARIGSPLEKIIFACQKLAEELEIGLVWDSLIFYVLAGIPPFIPPIEVGVNTRIVRLPSGRNIEYREAAITIREGFNLTWLRWLYKVIREEMHLTKKKGLNTNHLQLYRLVQNKGGAPKGKGTVAFWESIVDEWNTSHPKKQYKTWKGIKIGYERIMSKVMPDHIGWLQKEEAQNERSHSQEVQE